MSPSLKTAPRRIVPVTPSLERVDTTFMQSLLGYNARRVWLQVIELFATRMAAYGLTSVDFSVLSLVLYNPGITSRQICSALRVLPPNMVSKISAMEKTGLLVRKPHPGDGRAIGLHVTQAGEKLMLAAEETATDLEVEASSNLSVAERKTLIRLLQKVYL